ncbi:MAG: hypothetical protein NT136_03640 [Candidatus Moranbacteria bacterium]|nr:hypothetical protein [Candidatus Moranbacteria bacterium]
MREILYPVPDKKSEQEKDRFFIIKVPVKSPCTTLLTEMFIARDEKDAKQKMALQFRLSKKEVTGVEATEIGEKEYWKEQRKRGGMQKSRREKDN